MSEEEFNEEVEEEVEQPKPEVKKPGIRELISIIEKHHKAIEVNQRFIKQIHEDVEKLKQNFNELIREK